MTAPRYVRLKHLEKLIQEYPDAILSYPVDSNKYDYTNRMAGEVNVQMMEICSEDVGPGKPRERLLAVIA